MVVMKVSRKTRPEHAQVVDECIITATQTIANARSVTYSLGIPLPWPRLDESPGSPPPPSAPPSPECYAYNAFNFISLIGGHPCQDVTNAPAPEGSRAVSAPGLATRPPIRRRPAFNAGAAEPRNALSAPAPAGADRRRSPARTRARAAERPSYRCAGPRFAVPRAGHRR
jgi:hypothetical protein